MGVRFEGVGRDEVGLMVQKSLDCATLSSGFVLVSEWHTLLVRTER